MDISPARRSVAAAPRPRARSASAEVRRLSGHTIIEAVVALGIISIALVSFALMTLVTASDRRTDDGLRVAQGIARDRITRPWRLTGKGDEELSSIIKGAVAYQVVERTTAASNVPGAERRDVTVRWTDPHTGRTKEYHIASAK